MATYTVTCRGKLSRGVIAQLTNAGVYRHDEPELGFEGDGMKRHFLQIEAGSADDAILVAKGAMAVAGGEARDYQASAEGEPA
ncbi:MAG TPA: hypothetical protein VHV53_00715 [Solirubrobacterales bacterium]|jgi:hypothetical protein|nr:hypothetical protein [Solirubrobacterales bacterium]